MKILLVNPYLDALHEIMKAFKAKGIALLLSADPEEAWQMLLLHGNNVDLAIIHRELQPLGLGFIDKVKKHPIVSDLPIILSSEKWGDLEFATHQQTPQGANAYLKYPFQESELFKVIDQILSPEKNLTAKPFTPVLESPKVNLEVNQESSFKQEGGMVLEDHAVLLNQSERLSEGSKIITLEAPDGAESIAVPPPLPAGPEPERVFPQEPEKLPLEFVLEAQLEPPPPSPPPSPPPELPKEVIQKEDFAHELPYLYPSAEDSEKKSNPHPARPMHFHPPVGDAVVPGGAAQAPDVETLKKYLLLREQDVAALSTQLKTTREQLTSLEETLKLEKAKNVELGHVAGEQKRKIDDFDKIKIVEKEILQNEMDDLKFQFKAKSDKARLTESKLREAAEETERLKDRVRTDIRKIRVREKELENRLEIIKKDSEALLSARENKIVELKRKLDLLEFNMDLLQDQYQREKENTASFKDRFQRAGQAVRVASRILEGSAGLTETADEIAPVHEVKEKKWAT